MDILAIKEVVNSKLPDEFKEQQIIDVLAKDKNAITIVLKLLAAEREANKEMVDNMNLLLSKADMGLDNKKYNTANFIQKEIATFYAKYRSVVGHCFKNYNP